MRRREFTALLGGAALPVFEPPGASAQQAGRIYRLGFLSPNSRAEPAWDPFFDELRLAGFIEGQNLIVIPSGFDTPDDKIAEQAAALIRAGPDAIVSGADLQTRALQKLTGSIPLIGMTEDMVGAGLVASLARPGGTTTGISLLSPALDGKRQDILVEAVPGARHMAALADSKITTPEHLQALQEGAQARGVALSILGVAKPDEIRSAIHSAKASGADALNVLATPLFFRNRRAVIEDVATVRLPAIYQWPEMAEEGGLLGYGPRIKGQLARQRARMVIKILRGTKPADIPVEQPTLFELVVNLKTAKTIGHEVPHAILQRADEVIE
jgi:putative ABC transport system substrate-binding protein